MIFIHFISLALDHSTLDAQVLVHYAPGWRPWASCPAWFPLLIWAGMIGALSVFQPTVRKGFRRDTWHPIFDSGRGGNRWSVSKCGQQILAEQIMEAVTENLLKRDPQGLPMIQSCETLFKVNVISLGIFWMQPSQWIWWHSVSLFCIYSVFWVHLLLSAAERQTWESSSHQLKCSRSKIKCSLFNSAGKSVEMRRSGSLLKWTVNKICVRQ